MSPGKSGLGRHIGACRQLEGGPWGTGLRHGGWLPRVPGQRQGLLPCKLEAPWLSPPGCPVPLADVGGVGDFGPVDTERMQTQRDERNIQARVP